MATSSRHGSASSGSVSARTRVVWATLVLSMLGGAGLLMAIDGGRRAALEGVALPPLAASGDPISLESIFDTRAGLERDRWRAIVIHHSATPYGTPQSLDEAHRELGLQSLGHHFVIGNGSGMGDGQVHISARWLDQDPGAHAAGENAAWYDQRSIGICLVGHGDRRPFSRAQIRRLSQLVVALGRELEIPPERVLLHSEIASTTDPGWHFPDAAFRELIAGRL